MRSSLHEVATKMSAKDWNLGIPTTREVVFTKEALCNFTMQNPAKMGLDGEKIREAINIGLPQSLPVVWAPNQWDSILKNHDVPDHTLLDSELKLEDFAELWFFPNAETLLMESGAIMRVEFILVVRLTEIESDLVHVIYMGNDPDNNVFGATHTRFKVGSQYSNLDAWQKIVTRALLYRNQLIDGEYRQRRPKGASKKHKKSPQDRVLYLRKFKPGLHYEAGEGSPTGSLEWRVGVRGHWRNQAYGPNRSLRKPIFIAEHFRGPDGAPIKPVNATLVKVNR